MSILSEEIIEDLPITKEYLISKWFHPYKSSHEKFINKISTFIKYKIWNRFYTIDYNTKLFEATQEGRIANFLLELRSSKGKNKNFYILDESRALMKEIISRYEILRKNG